MKAEQEAEKKAQALAKADEERFKKERRVSEQREMDEIARSEKREREISKAIPEWKDVQQNEVFLAWLNAQSEDSKNRMLSVKSADVISVLKRYRTERKGFAEGYFQGMGTWIADKNGCRFLNRKPVPNETVTWSGKCEDGRGVGEGELIWLLNEKPQTKITGTFRDGMLDGFGRAELLNTLAFKEGNFVKGELNGRGRERAKDGSLYEGEYKQGKREGRGSVTSANGNTYVGEFVEGKPSGYGTWTSKDGGSYEGNFKDGQFNGIGKILFRDGGSYQGEFKEGKRTGKGKLTLPNGKSIEGDFVDGKLTGRNKEVWE